MTLTAVTKDGSRTINDSFQVQNSVPFDVERQTATRIFPPAKYPVNFNIKLNQDFTGQIIEYVPNSFTISSSTDSAAPVFDVKQIATPIQSSNGSLKSLRLVFPFNGKPKETLGFGQQLFDPQEKSLYAQFGLAGHDGLDFAMPIGTPVLAADDGTVVMAGGVIYGTTVVIQHSWGRSYYGHLSKVNVTIGQIVTKGQEIGLSGNTGITTGPHLHFSIKLNANDPNNGYYGKTDPSLYLGLSNSSAVLGASNINDTIKAIVWDVSVKKGDTLNLSYFFHHLDCSRRRNFRHC
jgi:murein DD-endopeptidase MepM/ murein hydrolase activator NlpD